MVRAEALRVLGDLGDLGDLGGLTEAFLCGPRVVEPHLVPKRSRWGENWAR